MNDWNRNGEYDAADSFMDYNMANNNHLSLTVFLRKKSRKPLWERDAGLL